MSERAVSFSEFSEIEKREKFSRDHLISVDKFHSLIGPYFFREDVHCQVERDGFRCNHGHRNGWLGRSKDGSEALIGGHCAIKYFNASDAFRQECRRVDTEVRLDSHITALTTLLDDRAALSARVAVAMGRVKAVREVVRQFESTLTKGATKQLNDMAKTGNRAISVEVQYVEKDDEEKDKTTWRRRDVGMLQGVSVWNIGETTRLYNDLQRVKDAVAAAVISRAEKENRLRVWRETLEQLPRIEDRIEAMERALADFKAPSNLVMLFGLGRDQSKNVELATLMLKVGGDPNPSNRQVQRLLSEYASFMNEQTDGRNYRPV
jgi:hypothetical protein